MSDAERPLVGIAWTIAGVLSASVLLTLPKAVASDLPAMQITLLRYVAGMTTIAPIYLYARLRPARAGAKRRANGNNALWWHVLRAVFAVTRLSCIFYAVTHMPFANAQAVTLTNGVFMILFAAILLRERVRPVTVLAAALCFAGGIIAAEPRLEAGVFLTPGALAALAGAVIWGVESAVIKHTAARDSVATIVFTVNVAAGLLILIPGIIVWQPVEPSQWAVLALMGPFAIATQSANILAFRASPANVLAPFRYSSVIFALVIGWFVFNEWPSAWGFSGMCLILVGGVVLARNAGRRISGTV